MRDFCQNQQLQKEPPLILLWSLSFFSFFSCSFCSPPFPSLPPFSPRKRERRTTKSARPLKSGYRWMSSAALHNHHPFPLASFPTLFSLLQVIIGGLILLGLRREER